MSAKSLHDSALETLGSWTAPDEHHEVVRQTMLAFLASSSRGCLREWEPGHLTASSLILDQGLCHVLLTLHPRVGRWIQLGGHCEESDETIQDAARREAVEESGISDLVLDPEPLSLHTHAITCSLGVPTRHLDVQFLAIARPNAHIVRSSESTDLRWFPVDELPDGAETSTINRLVGLARARRAAPDVHTARPELA
ncbi:MAG: NUDIX domain-containing protein [Rhodococcus sp.]|nr:NUDIX domain-containing protein [Rhodococcus sp. (in: high G+C Gram-positive bacteria)]